MIEINPTRINLISEGNGNQLQYYFLENPMDEGSWWAIVHGVTESDTTEELYSLSELTPHMWTKAEDITQGPDDSRFPYTALCIQNRACQAPGPHVLGERTAPEDYTEQ